MFFVNTIINLHSAVTLLYAGINGTVEGVFVEQYTC